MCVIASLSRHARHARTTRAKQNDLTHFGKKHGRQQLWRMPERKSGLDFWKRLGSVVDTSDLAGVALAKGRCTRWKRGHVFEQPALGGPFSGVCVCGSEIMIRTFFTEKSKLYFLSNHNFGFPRNLHQNTRLGVSFSEI